MNSGTIYVIISIVALLIALYCFISTLGQSPSKTKEMNLSIALCTLGVAIGNFVACYGPTPAMCYSGFLMTHITGPFTGLALYGFLGYVCNSRPSRTFFHFASCINVLITLVSLSDPITHYIVKSALYTKSGIGYVRNIEFSPSYYTYLLWLMIYMIPVTIRYYKTLRYKPLLFKDKKTELMLIGLAVILPYLSLSLSVFGRLRYDYTAIGMAIANLAVTIVIHHYDIYPLSFNVGEFITRNLDGILLAYDENKHLLQANNYAKQIYDEESVTGDTIYYGLRLDHSIPSFREIINVDDGETWHFRDKTYQCRLAQAEATHGRTIYIQYLVDISREEALLADAREARDEANKANASKSDFLAHMSHEIRTPINAVLGMDELILRESEDPNIHGYADNIMRAGKNLLEIINQILDYSKIEAGKMEIVPSPYRFSSLANDLKLLIGLRARKKGLNLYINLNQSIPDHLIGDELRIKQILTNILTNSVKYTETGSITLAADYRAKEGDSVDLLITITDTGVGIKKDDIDKLFNSFERIENDITHKAEGTGLGMSITSNLLALMGGELNVDSVYGQGSTFRITIPQLIDRSQPDDSQSKTTVTETAAPKPKRKSLRSQEALKILIVDDNETNRFISRALLKDSGMEFAEACNGNECIAKINEEHYDLILMDYMMPELNGIETMGAMRQQETHKCVGTPVILLTADARNNADEYFRKLGFAAYVTKPIEPESYTMTVASVLNNNGHKVELIEQ